MSVKGAPDVLYGKGAIDDEVRQQFYQDAWQFLNLWKFQTMI